jgi:hypothetical protein
MDPQYAQVGLPTSATRLNMATNWTYHPHPWPDGAQQHMGYPIPGHLYYSSHYRTNDAPTQLPPNVGPHQPPSQNGSAMPSPTSHSSPTDTRLPSTASDPSGTDTSTIQIIDPGSTTLTDQEVLAITEAAVKAVLEAEAGSSRTASRSGSVLTSLHSEGETCERMEEVTEAQAVSDHHVADKPSGLPGYGTPLERPEPMEHMLTEDGEPMLNPGLFTFCSEYSPPRLGFFFSSLSGTLDTGHFNHCLLPCVLFADTLVGITGFPSAVMTCAVIFTLNIILYWSFLLGIVWRSRAIFDANDA